MNQLASSMMMRVFMEKKIFYMCQRLLTHLKLSEQQLQQIIFAFEKRNEQQQILIAFASDVTMAIDFFMKRKNDFFHTITRGLTKEINLYVDDVAEINKILNISSFKERIAMSKIYSSKKTHELLTIYNRSMIFLDAEAQVKKKLIITALKIERYLLSKGKMPEKLEELVPDFMKQVPLDLDDQLIRYSFLLGSHYSVYSIAKNGKDDNASLEKDNVFVVSLKSK